MCEAMPSIRSLAAFLIATFGAAAAHAASPTWTTLTSSANPVLVGQPVTFTATVKAVGGGGTPTGTVTFKDASATLGTGSVDGLGQATLTTSSLALGTHAITAVYGGDGTFSASTSDVLQQAVPQVTCNTSSFFQPPGSPVAVGSNPESVAVGDFNLDERADLVVTNGGSSNVTILLGDGSGGGFSQAPGSPVGVGAGPRSVAVGDFNLDGQPDLVVANSNSNDITILLGDASGGFTQVAGSPVGVGSAPYSVAVGDFNLDGKPDLAVANGFSANATILLGDGSGGFTQVAGSPVAVGTFPVSVAIGDFSLDGKP